MPVQRRVVIFPVAVPQGQPHAEVDHALHPGPGACVQYRRDVFLRIVDEGQYGCQPDHGGDVPLRHALQHLDPAPGVAHVRLQYAAQRVVIGGQRHLHHAFGGSVDGIQQVDIPQDAIGFGLDRCAEAVLQYDLQATPGQAQRLLTVHVRVRHRARADHAPLPLRFQRPVQQLRRVPLHLYIFKGMSELIAGAPAVAINAAVGAAPVDVHAPSPLAAGQYALRVHKMHVATPWKVRCATVARAEPVNPLSIITDM